MLYLWNISFESLIASVYVFSLTSLFVLVLVKSLRSVELLTLYPSNRLRFGSSKPELDPEVSFKKWYRLSLSSYLCGFEKK